MLARRAPPSTGQTRNARARGSLTFRAVRRSDRQVEMGCRGCRCVLACRGCQRLLVRQGCALRERQHPGAAAVGVTVVRFVIFSVGFGDAPPLAVGTLLGHRRPTLVTERRPASQDAARHPSRRFVPSGGPAALAGTAFKDAMLIRRSCVCRLLTSGHSMTVVSPIIARARELASHHPPGAGAWACSGPPATVVRPGWLQGRLACA